MGFVCSPLKNKFKSLAYCGAFAFRRYDRGIREMHCISTPVTSPYSDLNQPRKVGSMIVNLR
nr:MAG TPA: hypothetical protein [Caudoviricetes sp.]